MIRDEPAVTLRPFGPDELRRAGVTIAIGTEPLELIAAAAGHEVYLTDPSVLAGVLGT